MTTALDALFGAQVSQGKGIRRITSDSKTGKQMLSQFKGNGVNSSHQPHIGARQQIRDMHKMHRKNHITDEACPLCIVTK